MNPREEIQFYRDYATLLLRDNLLTEDGRPWLGSTTRKTMFVLLALMKHRQSGAAYRISRILDERNLLQGDFWNVILARNELDMYVRLKDVHKIEDCLRKLARIPERGPLPKFTPNS